MKMGLTPTLARTLAAIEAMTKELGCAPSFDELAARLGIRSKGAVYRHIKALRERGHVDFMPQKSRSLVVLDGDDLPPQVRAQLARHCAATGERPGDVIADALALHFDALEQHESEEAHA